MGRWDQGWSGSKPCANVHRHLSPFGDAMVNAMAEAKQEDQKEDSSTFYRPSRIIHVPLFGFWGDQFAAELISALGVAGWPLLVKYIILGFLPWLPVRGPKIADMR